VKQLSDAVDSSGTQSKGERPLLGAATKKRLLYSLLLTLLLLAMGVPVAIFQMLASYKKPLNI
jgi:hypothetical protein